MIHSSKGRKDVRAVRGRAVAVAVLAVGIVLGLSACMGCWDTPIQSARLLVSSITVTGSQGTIYISVVDMPSGGAASIEFGEVGSPSAAPASLSAKAWTTPTTHPITITNIDHSTITVEGLGGFTILALEFTADGGSLIAANATTGVVSGQILKITFAVTGANPTFTITETEVEIGSALNTLIASWTLGAENYYTK